MIDIADAARTLDRSPRTLLTCHLSPDGDALGSMSALASLLRERGRDVTLYNPDPTPRALRFLPHVHSIHHKLPPEARFDLTVVLDCGDRKLLGDKFPPPEVTGPLMVVDHHQTSRPFGDLFVCDPDAASVGVLVARMAAALGWRLSNPAAVAIFTSMVADTGSFRYANTNAEAFRLASELVEHGGVNPWEIAEQLGERASLSRWRLLGAALATIELELDGKVAVMVVTEEMVRGAGAGWEDTEGLVNYVRALDGVECGVLLTPSKDGKAVRASLRSKGRVDAGAVCLPFGGGGNVGAAGCQLPGPIPEARATLLAALAGALGG